MRLEGRNQGKRNTDYAEWGMKIWMGISRKLERRASLGLSASATDDECFEVEKQLRRQQTWERLRLDKEREAEEAEAAKRSRAAKKAAATRKRNADKKAVATQKRNAAAKKKADAAKKAAATRKREKAMKIAVDKGYLSVNGEPLVYSERVHNVTKNFLINLAGFDKNIRNGEAFSFAFDAHIEDEDTLHLFIASVREILEENGLFERSMFEHDGFLDRDANADAERDYANVTEIRYLLLSDSNFLECPCCESSKDVHTIQVTDDAGGWSDMLRYKCMDVCDVSFRQTFGGDIVWDMAFPHCDTCGDSDDVYEDWENGICQAQDSENEHGCGPFYCSNCDGDNSDGHRISTDGGCVDTSCECDDWDD